MRAFENIKYGPLEEQSLSIYLPDSEEFDVLIWFHGGGLSHNGITPNRPAGKPGFADQLLKEQIAVVSCEYRKYPGARYPEFLLDAASAAAYVKKNIAQYGKPRQWYISGASAGAYITMMLCMNPAYLRNVSVDPSSIDAFISDSAQVTTHFNVLRERGIDSRAERIDEAAPLYYVSEDLKFTRLLMISYEDDMPARPEQNRLMYCALKRVVPDADLAYVELPGGHCHGSTKANADGSYDYANELLKFVRK